MAVMSVIIENARQLNESKLSEAKATEETEA
jgi:aspartate carbamoyltransferase catalytic subunit